jgi:Xaa-Pro dipeptidase
VATPTSVPFAQAEYDARLSAVQSQMGMAGHDLLLLNDPENIYYLSGFRTVGFYSYMALLVPGSGDPIHVNRLIEMATLQGTSCIEKRVLFPDTEDPLTATARTIADYGWDRGKIAIDPRSRYLTIDEHHKLREGLPSATWGDSDLLVEKLRLVKSPAEQEYSRAAAKAASAGMRSALNAVRAGVTESDLMAAAYTGLFGAGGEYPSLPPLINAGYRHSMAHATSEGHPVRDGDPVHLEIGGSVKRYHAANLRVASVGKPDSLLTKLSDLCRRSLEAGLEHMKPGSPAGAVDDAARKVIDDAGYGAYFRHKAGYSMGIAFPPDWSEAKTLMLRPGEERLLTPGMVFHLLPAVFEYEKFGIGVSDTVLITDDGYEILTDVPHGIHEVSG